MEPLSTILENAVSKNVDKLLTWLINYPLSKKISREIINLFKNEILEYQVKMALYFANTKTLLHRDLVPFLDIYYPLRIIPEISDSTASFVIDSNCINQLYKNNNAICVLGNAGYGKTTIVRFLFIDSVLSNFKIPILLNLRDLNLNEIHKGEELNLKSNIIFHYLLTHLQFHRISEYAEITIRLLRSGKFLLLLDGYDEINLTKKEVLNKHLYYFFTLFEKNSYLITSRFFAGADSLIPFKNYTIGSFSHEDMKGFIRKQFLNKNERMDQIIETVFKKENEPYLEYLNNPLFMILFLNSYDIHPTLPPKKSRFFENVYEALYETHDNFSKLGFNRKRFISLSKEHFEKILFTFSFFSYFDDTVQFSNTYLRGIYEKILAYNSVEFSMDDFIKELKINLNLLVEESAHLKFIHRSLQEFFAAKFLTFLLDDEKKTLLNQLAQNQKGENLFFISMVGELYPHDFYEYYFPVHVMSFCNSNKSAFERGFYDNDKYRKALDEYKILKAIININAKVLEIYSSFIKNYFEASILERVFYKEFFGTGMEQLAKESLILFDHKDGFLKLLKEFSDHQREANKKILDLIFRKKNKRRN
jgi:NACHT domain